MPAATNIPISATTTDFQAAIKAAQAITMGFDRDIAKLVSSFRNASSQSTTLEGSLNRTTQEFKMASASAKSLEPAAV